MVLWVHSAPTILSLNCYSICYWNGILCTESISYQPFLVFPLMLLSVFAVIGTLLIIGMMPLTGQLNCNGEDRVSLAQVELILSAVKLDM